MNMTPGWRRPKPFRDPGTAEIQRYQQELVGGTRNG